MLNYETHLKTSDSLNAGLLVKIVREIFKENDILP